MKQSWALALCTILLATGVAREAEGQSSAAQTHVDAAKAAAKTPDAAKPWDSFDALVQAGMHAAESKCKTSGRWPWRA